MSTLVQAFKSAVDFRQLALETHDLDRNGKVLCPAHDDHSPSCHIYPGGFKCFSCGARGDHVDWLKLIHNLSTVDAIKELERRAEGYVPTPAPRPAAAAPRLRSTNFKPVASNVLAQHWQLASQFSHVPPSMEGRGFAFEELEYLGFAALGDDAAFPVTGPDGVVLALKRRYAKPYQGQRYRYTTPGHGTPAWCSPGFSDYDRMLVVEGELNAMACFLAAPQLAVMGVAGTGGSLHLRAFEGRTVYVYADGDGPGQKARADWAAQALRVGALKVFVLEPWAMDACDVAGKMGREALAELLTRSRETASMFDAVSCFDAKGVCIKHKPSLTQKPALMFSCKGFSGRPHLRGKPCL